MYPSIALLNQAYEFKTLGYEVKGETIILDTDQGEKPINIFEMSFNLREWSVRTGYNIFIGKNV